MLPISTKRSNYTGLERSGTNQQGGEDHGTQDHWIGTATCRGPTRHKHAVPEGGRVAGRFLDTAIDVSILWSSLHRQATETHRPYRRPLSLRVRRLLD